MQQPAKPNFEASLFVQGRFFEKKPGIPNIFVNFLIRVSINSPCNLFLSICHYSFLSSQPFHESTAERRYK